MDERHLIGYGILLGAVLFAIVMAATGSLRYTKPVGYDDDQPRPKPYPPLGNYGHNNRDLPDVSKGWHIFADGNMWCAVGPAFENLQESPAGFGASPQLAYEELLRDLKRTGSTNLIRQPSLMDFEVHYPTVATNVG